MIGKKILKQTNELVAERDGFVLSLIKGTTSFYIPFSAYVVFSTQDFQDIKIKMDQGIAVNLEQYEIIYKKAGHDVTPLEHAFALNYFGKQFSGIDYKRPKNLI